MSTAPPRTTRPRGFAPWQPRKHALALIETIADLLTEYREHLPLSLRQLFYLLVVREIIGKTETAYKRMLEHMNRARRARLIEMDSIRDDTFHNGQAPGWTDQRHFMDSVLAGAESFTLDRQQGQARRLVAWCETAGMIPQLENIAHAYSIPVLSSGGFDSVTTKHATARDLCALGIRVEVLHIGDHDPSGVHMFGSLDADVRAFAEHYGGEIDFVRLAVTPEQIADYNLPTAPAKETDNRSFSGLTTQAEALDPKTLANIVREAIEERLDLDVYESTLNEEATIRENLATRFAGL